MSFDDSEMGRIVLPGIYWRGTLPDMDSRLALAFIKLSSKKLIHHIHLVPYLEPVQRIGYRPPCGASIQVRENKGRSAVDSVSERRISLPRLYNA